MVKSPCRPHPADPTPRIPQAPHLDIAQAQGANLDMAKDLNGLVGIYVFSLLLYIVICY